MFNSFDEQRTQVQKYFGKYPGRVVDNQQSADGAGLGELTVEVPGLMEETPDGKDSQPIKVIARPCFTPGFFFIPEIDAPVWVEFAAGDINQPLWTGVWYPQDGLPQTVKGGQPTEFQKIIRTPSGHVVQIDDTDKAEQIVIQHKSGAIIQVNEDGSVLVANANNSFLFLNAKDKQVTLGEEHGNLITMTDKGVLLANQGSKVTLEMKGDKLTILSNGSVDVMASKVALHSGTISLGGQAAVQPVILGTLFMALYNAHTHATALGPSGPPLPPLTPAVLSQAVKVRP